MTQKIIFLKGLPASGKSTWARQYVIDNPNTVRVNKDDIRMELHNGVFSKENEKEVIDYQINQAATALAEGKSVIVDNTHLSWTHAAEYRKLAIDMDVWFEIKSFLDVPCHECIARDKLRNWREQVWQKVIFSMAKKAWLLTSPPEFAIVPQNPSLPKAIIVDLDWTLAKMNGRSPYDETRVWEDDVHWDVATDIECYLVWKYHVMGAMPKFIIVSWRTEACKTISEEWLNKNCIHYDEIHMRKADDKRKDSQVKYEILLDLSKKFNIIASFDDRDQVVKMWREAWLRCYQVANGDF